ncbi:Golgi transport complex subunit 4 [Lobulomyces angularis]|nr:Golgi transport complex subunit 4 [Lobulomyces angularis]
MLSSDQNVPPASTETTINNEQTSMNLLSVRLLTDIETVMEQLYLLNQEERLLDKELDKQLQIHPQQMMEKIEFSRPVISTLRKESLDLQKVITDTDQLAEKISKKVRLLDVEQSRVKDTLKLLEDVQLINMCSQGVIKTIQEKDYEEAANFIHIYLNNFDLKQLKLVFETKDETDIEPDPLQVLSQSQRSVKDMITVEFDNAVSNGKQEEIFRYIRLFPKIGEPLLGLDKLGSYFTGLISTQCRDNMKTQPKDGQTFFANLLTKLFESTANIVDQQQNFITKEFGSSTWILFLLQKLHRQAELQASIILDNFIEKASIQRKLYDIKQIKQQQSTILASSLGTNNPDSKSGELMDFRELDLVLDEIALISQRTVYFSRFIKSRAKREIDQLEKPKLEFQELLKDYDKDGVSNVNKLSQRVEELMNDYLIMEEFYIKKGVEKAIKLDKFEAGNLTSSCVDDVFFLLKRSTLRCLQSFNIETLGVFMTNLGKILDVDYLQIFKKKLQNFNNLESKENKFGCMILINDIDLSLDYIYKLSLEVQNFVLKGIVGVGEFEKERMKASLTLFEEFGKNFQQVIKTWIEILYNQSLKMKCRNLLTDSLNNIKYQINEDEFRQISAEELFLKKFKSKNLCKELEKIIFSNFKFSSFGGLRFDKDVRGLMKFFGEGGEVFGEFEVEEEDYSKKGENYFESYKEIFLRLNQISQILNLEKVDEIFDIWGVGGVIVKWRLTSNEVKKVLALRPDFSLDEIKKLKL